MTAIWRPWLVSAAVLVSAGMFAFSARADIIDYSINDANTALSAVSGPYATLEVNRTSTTTATITFTGINNGTDYFLLGGENVADVNVNATSWTITSISFAQLAGFGSVSSSVTSSGAGNVSTFGSFNQTTKAFDGFTNSFSSISFVLTDTSGTWLNAGSVLANNGDEFFGAAHIFVCTDPCSSNQVETALTGFAAVPAPIVGAGLPGLIAACGALIALARRRRRRIA